MVPPRTRPDEVRRFVEAHRAWIEHARVELDVTGPPPLLFLPDRISLCINGEVYSVTYGHKAPRRGWQETGPARLVLSCQREGELHHGPSRTARLAASQRPVDSDSTSCATGAGHGHIVPKGPGARSAHALGSYSSIGTLSINYCLLFVPADLADYLFTHGLCHTRHMNHSVRFWQLVSRFAPNYMTQEKRLNDGREYLPDWLKDA